MSGLTLVEVRRTPNTFGSEKAIWNLPKVHPTEILRWTKKGDQVHKDPGGLEPTAINILQ